MKTLLAPSLTGPIQVDVCRRCQIIWLDTGEWKELTTPKLPNLSNSPTATRFGQYADSILEAKKESAEKMFEIESALDEPKWKLALALLGLPSKESADDLSHFPWITWTLIGMCTAVTVIFYRNMDFAVNYLATYGGTTLPVQMFSSLTSFFVHGSILHLLSNMYFLWLFGCLVEDHLSKRTYILLIISATICGSLLANALDPRSIYSAGIGASGGIAGLITFHLLRFPYRRFVTTYLWGLSIVPAILFCVLFIFNQVLGSLAQANGASCISYLAHLGGAGAGIFFALFCGPSIHSHPIKLIRRDS
ncbi:MAG: rhomboid family intramembrane serine protease [Bdellovibrionales bacterium]